MTLINEEFQKENELSPELSQKINNLYSQSLTVEQEKFSKKAHDNAEAILTSVGTSIKKKLGVDIPRNEGEKYEPFLMRISDMVLENEKSEVSKLKSELDEKSKNFKGEEFLKTENEKLKNQIAEIQPQLIEFNKLKEGDFENKYNELSEKNQKILNDSVFTGIMPEKPKNISDYEWKGKWKDFQADVEANYDIKEVEGETLAFSKKNTLISKTIETLAKENKPISEMLEQQTNKTGFTKAQGDQTIEGVPFKVNKEWSGIERSEAIRNHLVETKGLSIISNEYSEEFEKINGSILSGKDS